MERRATITTYNNRAKTRETGNARHQRRDPKRRRKRGQRAICKTRTKVWWAWASHVRGGGGETRIQEKRSKLGSVGGWAADDRRTESGKQAGRREEVYYMRRHLLAGGSNLLDGDCFSISPRQSSKTLAVEWEKIRICWVVVVSCG